MVKKKKILRKKYYHNFFLNFMREIAFDPSMSVCSGCATYLSGCVGHTNSRTANKQTDIQTNTNTNPQSDYNTSPSLYPSLHQCDSTAVSLNYTTHSETIGSLIV